MAGTDHINALTASLWYWELAGYVSVAAVVIGVAGEVLHDFSTWFKSVEWWKARGNKASALLLVVALRGELVIQVKSTSISGRIIAGLEDEAAAACERTAEIEKVAAWPIMEKKLSEALAAIPDSVPHKIVL